MATSTSALMSCLRTRPVAASQRMGAPHSTMATHAGSIGRSSPTRKEATRDTPDTIRRNNEIASSLSKRSLNLLILSDTYPRIRPI